MVKISAITYLRGQTTDKCLIMGQILFEVAFKCLYYYNLTNRYFSDEHWDTLRRPKNFDLLSNVKLNWEFFQIFVASSEYLTFTNYDFKGHFAPLLWCTAVGFLEVFLLNNFFLTVNSFNFTLSVIRWHLDYSKDAHFLRKR